MREAVEEIAKEETDAITRAGLAGEIKGLAAKFGGFTIAPDGTQPTTGYAVAPSKTTERILDLDSFGEAELRAYMTEHAELLELEGAHLGGWVNEDDGKLYLDVSVVMQDLAGATELAEEADQIAIFDLGTLTEIRTEDARRQIQQAPGGIENARGAREQTQGRESRGVSGPDGRELSREGAAAQGELSAAAPLEGALKSLRKAHARDLQALGKLIEEILAAEDPAADLGALAGLLPGMIAAPELEEQLNPLQPRPSGCRGICRRRQLVEPRGT